MTNLLTCMMHVILTIIPILSQTQDICLWGRTGYNAAINGLYSYEGTYNNKPYYRKYIGSNCHNLYISWTGSRLDITNQLGDTSFYAYCGDSSSDPNTCNSWYVYNGNTFNADSNIFTQLNSCPFWDCDQVSTPSLSNNCGVTFDQHIDINVWKSSSNGRYWFFNPYHFNWVCDDAYSIIACPTQSYWTVTDEEWKDLSKGQSTQFDFIYPNYDTHTVNCIQNPTPSPTPALPTPAPTDCVGNVYEVLDTTTLTEWTEHADLETLKSSTIETIDDGLNCYGINPCIKVIGISGTIGIGKIYIERILDTTDWDDITINVEVKTSSLDTIDEKGFVETICNADTPQITEFNGNMGTDAHYSGCFYLDTSSCDSVTLRIGGYLSGAADYLYITRVLLQYTASLATVGPTTNPSIDPTVDPTSDPISSPTKTPSKLPTKYPSKPPTKYPSKSPTIRPTLRPTADANCDEERTRIIISFEYQLSNNDGTDSEIRSSVNSTARQLIENRNTELTDCNISIRDVLVMLKENDAASVNITVCTNCDDHKIKTDLDTDFIDINNEKDDILTVTEVTAINVDVIKIEMHNERVVETTSMSTTKLISYTKENKESSSFWTIFGVIICIILMCCFIFCVMVYFKKKRSDQIETVNNNTAAIAKKQSVMSHSERDGGNLTVPQNTDINDDIFGEDIDDDDDDGDADNTGSSQYNKESYISSDPKMVTPANPPEILMAVHDDEVMGNDDHDTPDTATSNEQFNGNDSDEKYYKNDNNGDRERGITEYDDMERQREYTDDGNIAKNEDENNRFLVKEWLTIKCKLPQYYHVMMENGYESLDIIKEIQEIEELVELGIILKGHQLKLMVEIKKLKQFKKDNFIPHNIEYNVNENIKPFKKFSDIQYQYEGGGNEADEINMDKMNEPHAMGTAGSFEQQLADKTYLE